MRPILFHVFGLPVPAWHFCLAAAALATLFYFRYQMRKAIPQLANFFVSAIFVATYLGAILGALAWSYFVENWDGLPSGDTPHFSMSSSGGFLGGAMAGGAAAIFFRIGVMVVADAVALPVLLGFSIGRVGCFLNGCDYGIVDHPVQLYESLACLTGVLLIAGISKWGIFLRPSNQAGITAGMALIWYSSARFILEEFRGDWRGPTISLVGALKISPPQFLAMIMFGTGCWILGRKIPHE